MKINSVKSLKNIKGKRILVRVDFNVPIQKGKIVDDFRIKQILPTIKFLQAKKARIILMSHSGNEKQSLRPVANYLNRLFETKFVGEVVGEKVTREVEKLKDGEVILLENLRKEKGEEKNDSVFARKLASLGDIYINEAFSVSHRQHASIVSLPKYLPAYAGILMEKEIKNLELVMKNIKRPFTFILGGAKFSTKIHLIEKYLKLADFVFVGGALANNFFKSEKFEIGRSLYEKNIQGLAELVNNPEHSGLFLPIDVSVQNGQDVWEKDISMVASSDMIVDIGAETLNFLNMVVKKSKTVLWNGPLGIYEEGYDQGSKKLLNILIKNNKKVKTIIGGGDTVSLVAKMKALNKISFVSTGGGATLEFLVNGTLPGIEALEK